MSSPFPVLFHTVLGSFAGAFPALLAGHQFSIKQSARQAVFLHPDDTPSPTRLDLEEHCFNARPLGSVQNLKAGHLALPADAKNGTEGTSVKFLQPLEVPAVRCPDIAPMREQWHFIF